MCVRAYMFVQKIICKIASLEYELAYCIRRYFIFIQCNQDSFLLKSTATCTTGTELRALSLAAISR